MPRRGGSRALIEEGDGVMVYGWLVGIGGKRWVVSWEMGMGEGEDVRGLSFELRE